MDTFDKLCALISEVLGIAPEAISLDITPKDLDADSIDMLDVVGEAEQVFQVEITDEALEGFETIGDFVAYLDARI
ncbi:MAG: acyl carrier protein [Oscillospiraceae bacterium]|jgi:acyl carrier protein|nr:acyl carrier protein [Oscillospiraceae bacterium]